MADDKRADPRWLVGFGLVLAAIVALYLLTVSHWFSCGAQIDPETLKPVCEASALATNNQSNGPMASNVSDIAQRTWPDFGLANDQYNGSSSFWGDDIVSKGIEALVDAVARISRPFVAEQLVPRWDEAMKSPVNRRLLYGAVVLVLGVISTEWAKDLYRSVRRPVGSKD